MTKAKQEWTGWPPLAFIVIVVCITLIGLAAILSARPDADIAPRASVGGWLGEESITVSATGVAGAASGTGSSTIAVRGHLAAIHLDWTASISSTTDITITLGTPSLTVLDLDNNITDTWYYPAITRTKSSGVTIGDWDALPINGPLDIAVGSTTSGTVVIATFWWGE